ncbi:MAG TPA: Cj0069 family protein [Ramlibacter sp.]|nr:Cj0069 family protein [Ramlibacter sp.]
MIALLYPGDRAMRERADPSESRFSALFDAFAAAGVRAVPAVYHDDFAEEVEAQLRGCALVLVWCNPIQDGNRRDKLDAMLRRVADSGVIVSAHPDAVLKLGTKDVLFESRELAFGSDVHRIETAAQLEAELPVRSSKGPRVLKQYRGHSGIGIWRIEGGPSNFRVRQAPRGSEEATMDLAGLVSTMAPYFEPENGGHMIDQAWQPQLADGMVRAYLVEDRVAGFGHQAVNAFAAPQAGPRLYYAVEELPQFHGLKQKLETGWVEQLCTRVGLPRAKLPLLWDCDFIGKDDFVLCEINVSSVSPFPPSAISHIVSAVRARL